MIIGTGSFNGLSFGPGTSVNVAASAGLDDLPSIRSADALRPADPGWFGGVDYLDGRLITLTFWLVAADSTSQQTLVDQLRAAFITTAAELPLVFANNTRRVMARVRKRSIPYDAAYVRRTGQAIVELYATDPRVYDNTLQSFTVGLPVANGGLTWPVVWPTGWGAAAVAGTIQFTNAGNFPTRPLITFTGPVDNPTIENITTGQHLTFSTTLIITDTLVVDLDARSVVLNGTTSRRPTMTADSQWWECAPGLNQINYRANTVSVGSTATVAARSAWV